MKFIKDDLSDVIIIEPKLISDARGFFLETWHHKKFRDGGIDTDFVQDNQSRSVKNTLRGLHYQIKHPQGKLLRVIAGKIYDVAVDIRRESPNFGKWTGHILSSDNKTMLWVPVGFAHGFLVISDFAEVCYKCTEYYTPEYERAIRWDDPEIGIEWPLSEGELPILSDKDRNAKLLKDAEVFP